MKKVAILQSNYIPWKGYFDLIAAVDEFIIYDDVQYTKNDWRNRNQIKTPLGKQWLTVPVGQNLNRRICDVTLPNNNWQIKHWKTLEANYRRAPYFNEVADLIETFYFKCKYSHLSELNRNLIVAIINYLGISTKISSSSDYKITEGKTERLVDLCLSVDGAEYISGPSAQNYINESLFIEHGIKLTWFGYDNYPEYPQLWGEFEHAVSILDLLFNCGRNSIYFMNYVERKNE